MKNGHLLFFSRALDVQSRHVVLLNDDAVSTSLFEGYMSSPDARWFAKVLHYYVRGCRSWSWLQPLTNGCIFCGRCLSCGVLLETEVLSGSLSTFVCGWAAISSLFKGHDEARGSGSRNLRQALRWCRGLRPACKDNYTR